MIAFGRFFVANPDLVTRLQYNFPLTDFKGELLFGGDSRGYTDYPLHIALTPIQRSSVSFVWWNVCRFFPRRCFAT